MYYKIMYYRAIMLLLSLSFTFLTIVPMSFFFILYNILYVV